MKLILHAQHFECVKESALAPISVKWADADAIFAFKRDMWSYDVICVDFELRDGSHVGIDEEMDGFMKIMEAASQQCAGCVKVEDWYSGIMVPAFEANLTELYRRPLQSQHADRISL
jgi:hypothetical protein